MDISNLIKSTSFPINDLFGQSPVLLLNDSGKILEKYNTGIFNQRPHLLTVISRKGDIFELFDMVPFHSLSEAMAGQSHRIFYAGQERFGYGPIGTSLYTRIPICSIKIVPCEKELFLGVITLFQRDSGIDNIRTINVLWADPDTDEVLGISRNLHARFRGRYENPYDMLGRPVSEFLDPAPKAIQSRALQNKTPTLPKEARVLLEWKPGLPTNRVFSENTVVKSIRPDGSLYLSNTENTHLFLETLAACPPGDEDFDIEASFTALQGGMPLVLTGFRAYEDLFPDNNGMAFGESTDHTSWIIKRVGYKVAEKKKELSAWTTPQVIHVLKRGQRFYLEARGEPSLGFFDLEGEWPASWRFFIALRPGSEAVLNGFSVRTAPAVERPPFPETIVTLKSETPAYLSIQHMRNPFLQGRYERISTLYLNDITVHEIEKQRLRSRLRRMETDRDFTGKNPAIDAIRKGAKAAAGAGATILIEGETGTGKEVLARYIHANSRYHKGPFVKVDCATLAPNLLESELFGHEKGAFTGAHASRQGKFESADKGVLFLDEIGNVTPDAQAKLLRFLQDRVIERVGGNKTIRLDLQVVTATNTKLNELVCRGLFRKDLYFRLNVFRFELPPLRERKEDLPDLCSLLLDRFADKHNKPGKSFNGAAFQKLSGYSWPGNIRELEGVLEKAVVFCDPPVIGAEDIDLPEGKTAFQKTKKGGHEKKRLDWTREMVEKALTLHQGNMRKAAAELGVSRNTLYLRLRRLGLGISPYRNT